MSIENTGENQVERDENGRFVPGVSGNPAGKPQGARHMTTLLKEAIAKVAEDGGKRIDREIIEAVIEKAKKGDMKAVEHIWDRLEGKAPQSVKMEHSFPNNLIEAIKNAYSEGDN